MAATIWLQPFFYKQLNNQIKKIIYIMLTLIIGMIIGAILDNKFAPKVKMENGKITLEYSNKKKTP